MAADPLVSILETRGYTNIQVLGGGRISRDDDSKIISIFGYSYGFGRADHAKSKEIIEADERFGSYNVKWSNEGY
jgi:phosphohistidine phosphatase